ncbi:MAG: biopolymer transporter ExbD [Gemmatimonadota bacterium]
MADRSDLRMNAEINVTSLIDVAFTLLVIFIITAPVLQGGVEVNLPQAEVQALEPPEDPLILTVIANGEIVVGETPISVEEFDEVFPQLFEIANPTHVFIRGDSAAVYGRVLPVFVTVSNVARAAGVPVRLIAEDLGPN